MSRRTQRNVGVIGLGIIGRRVADNLRRRGFHVFVWNRTPRPFPNFVGSPAEVAELCDFVQIFVSDDAALLQMVQEIKPALGAHHIVMAHSTVAPHTMRNAAEIVQRRGAQFLDAPFTGSKIPAEKGELVYYVAGDEAAYRRARPVLEASSKEIIEIGEIGQATTVKLATNMVTAATVQAAAEALALVHNSGLAPDKFAAALRGNASNSGTLSMKLPKMIEGDFDPHFSVKHMLKDVQIAARMARSYGLQLGATEAARDSLLEEAKSGRADQDFSSLLHFYFPDGLPRKTAEAQAEEDAQQILSGVDEEAVAQVSRTNGASAAHAPVAGERRIVSASKADEQTRAEVEGSADEASEAEAKDDDAATDELPDVQTTAAAEPEQKDRTPTAAQDTDAESRSTAAQTDAAAVEETSSEISDNQPDVADHETDAALEKAPDTSDQHVPQSERIDPEPLKADDAADGEDSKPKAAATEAAEVEEPVAADVPDSPAERETGKAAEADVTGEPPTERRMNGERAAERATAAPVEDDVAVRRSFLSRMFGRADDY